jgi:hypothetical protein
LIIIGPARGLQIVNQIFRLLLEKARLIRRQHDIDHFLYLAHVTSLFLQAQRQFFAYRFFISRQIARGNASGFDNRIVEQRQQLLFPQRPAGGVGRILEQQLDIVQFQGPTQGIEDQDRATWFSS